MLFSVRSRRIASCVVVLGIVSIAVASQAEDVEELIKQGVALRKRGEDVKAHGYFQRAYEIAHTPRSAAQLALCDLALSKWLDAEVRLGEAIASSDPWVDSNRAALEKSRDTARGKLGKVEIDGVPADTTVEATGRPTMKLPADGAIWVTPGTAHVKLTAPGFQPATQDVIVAEKGSARLHPMLKRIEPERDGANVAATAADGRDRATVVTGASLGADDHGTETSNGTGDGASAGNGSTGRDHQNDTAEQHNGLRIGSIAVAGVGVAAGITGLVLRNTASNKLAALNNDGAKGLPYNPANGNYQTYDHVGVALLIGGGAAIVGGAVGFILSLDSSQPVTERKTVMLGPGPGKVGLGFSSTY